MIPATSLGYNILDEPQLSSNLQQSIQQQARYLRQSQQMTVHTAGNVGQKQTGSNKHKPFYLECKQLVH